MSTIVIVLFSLITIVHGEFINDVPNDFESNELWSDSISLELSPTDIYSDNEAYDRPAKASETTEPSMKKTFHFLMHKKSIPRVG